MVTDKSEWEEHIRLNARFQLDLIALQRLYLLYRSSSPEIEDKISDLIEKYNEDNLIKTFMIWSWAQMLHTWQTLNDTLGLDTEAELTELELQCIMAQEDPSSVRFLDE